MWGMFLGFAKFQGIQNSCWLSHCIVHWQCIPIIFMTHRSFSVILSSYIGNLSQVRLNLYWSWLMDRCNWDRLHWLTYTGMYPIWSFCDVELWVDRRCTCIYGSIKCDLKRLCSLDLQVPNRMLKQETQGGPSLSLTWVVWQGTFTIAHSSFWLWWT